MAYDPYGRPIVHSGNQCSYGVTINGQPRLPLSPAFGWVPPAISTGQYPRQNNQPPPYLNPTGAYSQQVYRAAVSPQQYYSAPVPMADQPPFGFPPAASAAPTYGWVNPNENIGQNQYYLYPSNPSSAVPQNPPYPTIPTGTVPQYPQYPNYPQDTAFGQQPSPAFVDPSYYNDGPNPVPGPQVPVLAPQQNYASSPTAKVPEWNSQFPESNQYQNSSAPDHYDFNPSAAHPVAGMMAHNNFRKKHGSPLLKLDVDLNKAAHDCAVNYARTRTMDNSFETLDTGENFHLFEPIGPPLNLQNAVKKAVQAWYDERINYDYDNPGASTGFTGHFTQLVWKESSLLGIGAATVNGYTAVVAKYKCQGNIVLEGSGFDKWRFYRENVQRPVS